MFETKGAFQDGCRRSGARLGMEQVECRLSLVQRKLVMGGVGAAQARGRVDVPGVGQASELGILKQVGRQHLRQAQKTGMWM